MSKNGIFFYGTFEIIFKYFIFFFFLIKLVKLCIGMIDAGKAYVTANKQFVNGIRELAQQSPEDEVIEVRSINCDSDWLKAVGIETYCYSYSYQLFFSYIWKCT